MQLALLVVQRRLEGRVRLDIVVVGSRAVRRLVGLVAEPQLRGASWRHVLRREQSRVTVVLGKFRAASCARHWAIPPLPQS